LRFLGIILVALKRYDMSDFVLYTPCFLIVLYLVSHWMNLQQSLDIFVA